MSLNDSGCLSLGQSRASLLSQGVVALTCNSDSKGQVLAELRTVSFKKERDNASEGSRMIAVDKKELEGLKVWAAS